MSEIDDTLGWAPAPGHDDEVLYAVDGPLGRARLNRPHAINAINEPALHSLVQQLGEWASDDAVAAVVLDGAGDRGLCAGGDVRWLREQLLAGRTAEVLGYWAQEYALNASIADYPKPYVAWMDGIVMGGGVGVSAHGSLRLVTERTRLAMPETVIGLFPDVGALTFYAHAPGELGTHAALTGMTMGAADAMVLGMGDVVVASARKDAVLDALRLDPTTDAAALAEPPGESWLEANRAWIEECYVGDDAVAILHRLRAHAAPEAREAAELIGARSPHSVAVTLEALRRAASMDVHDVLAQDVVLGAAFAAHPDLVEGIRAQVVDKDRQPRWADASVADVTREQVLAAFGE